MLRRVVWLQLLIGWLPVWGLITILIVTVHVNVSMHLAMLLALRMIVAAAALGVLVHRVTERLPWPGTVRPSFVLTHVGLAVVYSTAFVALNSVIESVMRGVLVFAVGNGLGPFLAMGVWLYAMIAGVSYTSQASERAARAEGHAARSQLAALRSQLQPHFLFNALHTVVQLIPKQPAQAALAAEQLAGLLRRTIEEDRDVVPAAEEWAFVEQYLALERLRFGDRLVVHTDISDDAGDALIPLFALQTLVENAVRHGAAPRVEPSTITITGRSTESGAMFTVHDTGGGASAEALAQSTGTGLRRLRERLLALYGSSARLDTSNESSGGFSAVLRLPRTQGEP